MVGMRPRPMYMRSISCKHDKVMVRMRQMRPRPMYTWFVSCGQNNQNILSTLCKYMYNDGEHMADADAHAVRKLQSRVRPANSLMCCRQDVGDGKNMAGAHATLRCAALTILLSNPCLPGVSFSLAMCLWCPPRYVHPHPLSGSEKNAPPPSPSCTPPMSPIHAPTPGWAPATPPYSSDSVASLSPPEMSAATMGAAGPASLRVLAKAGHSLRDTNRSSLSSGVAAISCRVW
jgi:hypothetical protein